MNWAILIPIIAQDGLPLAEALFNKFTSNQPPTAADFAELRALASQTAQDRMKARLVAQGIQLDSDQAKTLLALVQ
jgi:protein-tyrosine-phosphatase